MGYPRITFAGLFAIAGVVASVSVVGQTVGANEPAMKGIARTAWGGSKPAGRLVHRDRDAASSPW